MKNLKLLDKLNILVVLKKELKNENFEMILDKKQYGIKMKLMGKNKEGFYSIQVNKENEDYSIHYFASFNRLLDWINTKKYLNDFKKDFFRYYLQKILVGKTIYTKKRYEIEKMEKIVEKVIVFDEDTFGQGDFAIITKDGGYWYECELEIDMELFK